MKNQNLQSAWGREYPGSIFDVVWLLDSFGRFFYHPLGFINKTDVIAIVAFIVGCAAFLRAHKGKFLILISPVIMTLIASYLHKYPFRARLVLFLTPFFILIIAEGTAFLLAQFGKRKSIAIAGAIVACLLLLPPVFRAGTFVFYPETKHEIRPVIEYIKAHQKLNEVIYVNAGSVLQFEYYAGKYGYSKSDYVPGYGDFLNPTQFSKQGWEEFKDQTSQLQTQSKQRVWFLFSGLNDSKLALVKPRLDQIGQELDSFKQPGAFTYLYQLDD